MGYFRKRPVVIEAKRLTRQSAKELAEWCGGTLQGESFDASINIDTLEGVITASMGDWIIKGVQGEFYPCKPDIFEQTYEAVEPENKGVITSASVTRLHA